MFEIFQRSFIILVIAVFGYNAIQIIAAAYIVMSVAKLILGILKEPYHKKSAMVTILILNSIETWVNLSLCIEVFFQWFDFSMNTLLALLGAPVFAIMIVYVWFERNTGLLHIKTKNTKSYELYLKMRKLIQIFELSDDMENTVWLNGLLSKHVQKCKRENCPFNEEFKKFISEPSISPEDNAKVYWQYLSMKYKKIIRGEPECIFLRVTYALFLSEYVKNRVYALTQLEETLTMNPGICEELQIARYKRVCENELSEEKMLVNKMTQSNIELAIKFDALCNKFRSAMYEAATAFSELWGYLKNELASSFQLERMTNNIFEQGKIVDETWDDILQIKGDLPKILYLYSQYQLKVINDTKNSLYFFKKAKTEEIIQAQAHQENELTLKDMRNITDYASDGSPCIYISANPDRIGEITNLNMSACQIFGYSKNAVLHRNIKAFIPDLIAKNHDRVLKEAEKRDVSYFSKRRNFFTYGRQITGYIIPFFLNVKKVLSFSLQGDQYAGLALPLQSGAKLQEMYMILDTKLNICEITESCYRILRIKKEVIKKQKVNINIVIPDFPTLEKIEQDLVNSPEGYNQLLFREEEYNVFLPKIDESLKNEKEKDDFVKDSNNDDNNDSVFSNLRKNEVTSQDSFRFKDKTIHLEVEEEPEGENEDVYSVTTGSEKIPCKVGYSGISICGHVGYAVRILILNTQNSGQSQLNPKNGKYEISYNTNLNCFIRLQVEGKHGESGNEHYLEKRGLESSMIKEMDSRSPLQILIFDWKKEQ